MRRLTIRLKRSNPSVDVAAEGKKFEVVRFPGDYSKKFNKVGFIGSVRPEGDKLIRLGHGERRDLPYSGERHFEMPRHDGRL